MLKKITLFLDDSRYELGDGTKKIAVCKNIEIKLTRHQSIHGNHILHKFYSDFYIEYIKFHNGTEVIPAFASWLNNALLKNQGYEYKLLTIRSPHFNADLTNVQLLDYVIGPNFRVTSSFPNLLVTAGASEKGIKQIIQFFNQNFEWKKQNLDDMMSKKG